MAARGTTELTRRFNMTVTQSAANTFTQAMVPTGLTSMDTVAMLIRHIDHEWILNTADMPGLAADGYVIGCLTDASKSATARLTDEDLIWRRADYFPLTTSGAYHFVASGQQELPEGTIVVAPNLFVAVGSSGMGNAASLDLRIEYELVKLSEVDFFRLLATQ